MTTPDQPRPLGRPPMPPGEAHRPRRTVRVSDELWARIQAAAERAGVTAGEWIRRACEEWLKDESPASTRETGSDSRSVSGSEMG